MKKQALKNKEIYGIGNKVLRATRLDDDTIDSIVAATDLFARIRTAGDDMERSRPVPVKPVNAARWHSVPAFAAAFAAVLMFAGVLAVTLVRMDLSVVAEQIKFEDITADIRHLAGPEDPAAPIPPISARPSHTGEIKRNAKIRLSAQSRQAAQAAKAARQKKDIEMGEFQTLSYADGPDQKTEGDRIVRVELSRASLYAMGVDIPVENESDRVKADLLIGFDGVMKSVRFEKR